MVMWSFKGVFQKEGWSEGGREERNQFPLEFSKNKR